MIKLQDFPRKVFVSVAIDRMGVFLGEVLIKLTGPGSGKPGPVV
jgi:hypothetical protein